MNWITCYGVTLVFFLSKLACFGPKRSIRCPFGRSWPIFWPILCVDFDNVRKRMSVHCQGSNWTDQAVTAKGPTRWYWIAYPTSPRSSVKSPLNISTNLTNDTLRSFVPRLQDDRLVFFVLHCSQSVCKLICNFWGSRYVKLPSTFDFRHVNPDMGDVFSPWPGW